QSYKVFLISNASNKNNPKKADIVIINKTIVVSSGQYNRTAIHKIISFPYANKKAKVTSRKNSNQFS
ncbi:hypothetical protein, partial [Acinetobacter bouvetii]|uniref:hypothetical protein n=1 Tax=Acinetobacter bouvetii TaxID=202951 RepID=UPI001BC876DF